MIDVSAEIDIAASPAHIAAVMFDPQRTSEWRETVTSVEVHDAALAPGARVTHHGSLMGKTLKWTTQVETVHFPHSLVFTVADGPLVGTMRLGIQRSGDGSRVQMRNTGELQGLGFIPESMVTGLLQSTLRADLVRLKALIEAAPAG